VISVFHKTSIGALIQKRGNHLGLTLAVLIAAGCFCFMLGHLSYSLWFDECQTATVVSAGGIQQVIDSAMNHRPYPPVYFLITRLFWKVKSDEFGLRLPSALSGAFTVVILFLLGRRMSGTLTGIMAALLLVFSPGILFYFADANAYALLTLLTTLATYFLYRGWQNNQPRDWLFYSLVSLLGLGTHQIYIFILGSQILAALLLFYPWQQFKNGTFSAALAHILSRRKWFFLSLAVLLGCWVSWVLFYLSHQGISAPLALSRIWSPATREAFDTTFYGILRAGRVRQAQLFPWLLALGAMVLLAKKKSHFVFLAILYSLPFISITLFIEMSLPFNSPRYVAAIYPLACLIAAHCLKLATANQWIYRRALFIALVIPLSFLMLRFMSGGYSVYRKATPDLFELQDWRGAAAYLNEKASPGDLVLIHQWFVQEALDYYYKGSAKQIPVHEEALDPVLSEVSRYAKSGSGSVWVVECTMAQPYPPLIEGLEKQSGLRTFTKQHFHNVFVWGYELGLPNQP
jgi:hypothetical protein